MTKRKAFTLVELIVMVVVLAVLAVLLVVHVRRARWRAAGTLSMKCMRQIGLAMLQYAGDHDDAFMSLVDANGNEVPAVAADGTISKEPARSAFAILLKRGYITATIVFVHPMTDDHVPEKSPGNYRNEPLQKLLLAEDECSFGWDPTKKHSADATCAIIADKPSKDVSMANEGTARNNSDNCRKVGQCVFYNDGHTRWQTTPESDAGDDPDIYTGGPGYEHSNTDAKIVR
ncbi:MAG TPA: hypothetical protein VMZ92_03365 [Planctomycetota bacterium]|nr:hypothetical protein [Planctomycetota bacterium]